MLGESNHERPSVRTVTDSHSVQGLDAKAEGPTTSTWGRRWCWENTLGEGVASARTLRWNSPW